MPPERSAQLSGGMMILVAERANREAVFSEDGATIELVAHLFALLADPLRLRIVLALQRGELDAQGLIGATGAAPAQLASEIAQLRLVHAVTTRRHDTTTFTVWQTAASQLSSNRHWLNRNSSARHRRRTAFPAELSSNSFGSARQDHLETTHAGRGGQKFLARHLLPNNVKVRPPAAGVG